MKLTLELENRPEQVIASREELAGQLAALGAAGNGFAVLSDGRGRYIQAMGSREAGYFVEICDGAGDTRHRSRREDISYAEVIEITLAWYDTRADHKPAKAWQERLEWDPPLVGKRAVAAREGKKPGLVRYRNGFILLVAGAVMAWGAADSIDFAAHAAHATGRVLRTWFTGASGQTGGWLHLKVRFHVKDKAYVFEDVQTRGTSHYRAGDTVPVIYDVRDPAITEQVGDDRDVSISFYGAVVMSALLTGTGLVFLFQSWRAARRRRRPRRGAA